MERIAKNNVITTIIGKKGSGKSSLTDILLILDKNPKIIADPLGQYLDVNQTRRLRFASVAKLQLWLSKSENHRLFRRHCLELVVNVDDDSVMDLAKFLMAGNNDIAAQNPITLCIDELDMFFNASASPKNPIYRIYNYGRHRQMNVISTTRRPASISRYATSQSDHFYIARLTEPKDIDYFVDTFGSEYVDTVQSLERFTFLHVKSDFGGFHFSLVRTQEADFEKIEKI